MFKDAKVSKVSKTRSRSNHMRRIPDHGAYYTRLWRSIARLRI